MASHKLASSAIEAASKSPLRLLALPLCRNPELVYYYASKRKGHSNANASLSQAASTSSVKSQKGLDITERLSGLVSKATNKATEQWEKFGKAPQGNWKYRIYMTGEKLMDRVEYEEWLLKALDASAAPKLLTRRPKPTDQASSDTSAASEEPPVPLYYPSSLMQDSEVMQDLTQMLEHREPHHQSLMKKSLIAAPLTMPFAIVPVVPNFPLFYVLWRAWSHWRALKSSQYLKSLIAHNHLVPQASSILDELYAKHSPFSNNKTEAGSEEKAQILLNDDMIGALIQKFELDEQAGTDLRRAVSQLEARVKSPKN